MDVQKVTRWPLITGRSVGVCGRRRGAACASPSKLPVLWPHITGTGTGTLRSSWLHSSLALLATQANYKPTQASVDSGHPLTDSTVLYTHGHALCFSFTRY